MAKPFQIKTNTKKPTARSTPTSFAYSIEIHFSFHLQKTWRGLPNKYTLVRRLIIPKKQKRPEEKCS